MKKLCAVAVVESPYGDIDEQIVAWGVNETLTKEEVANGVKKLTKMLGKGYIVCDTYEDYR